MSPDVHMFAMVSSAYFVILLLLYFSRHTAFVLASSANPIMYEKITANPIPATILLEFGELPCHTAISATHGLLELQKPHSAILLSVLLKLGKILAARLQLRFSKMQ